MTVDGKLRDYRLFIPSTIDETKPAPLVIMLHGSPIDAAGWETYFDFDSEAIAAGFLEASPNGCNGYWDYAEGRAKTADQDFIQGMIQQLELNHSIDRTRVFVVGASAGSWVAYRLACDLAGTVSAIASLSGTMRLSDACAPSRPVSILEMHGSLDAEHPWNGDGPHGAFPVDGVVQRWVSLDGCVSSRVTTRIAADVTSTWDRCQAGVRVRLDKIVGGDHGWFLSPPAGIPDPKATVWGFFSSIAS